MIWVWAIILSIVGLAFVLAEVFFPSLGAFGVVAGACILFADTLAFREHAAVGWGFVIAQVILVPYVVRLGFRVLPRTPFGRRMMLTGPTSETKPGTPNLSHLVGTEGRSLSDLRPSGTARFGTERVSVVSQVGMLDAGTPIIVVSVEGAEVLVRPSSTAEEQAPASS